MFRITLAVLSMACLGAATHADLVYQADFNAGSGGLVTLGGSGFLVAGLPATTSFVSGSPLATDEGTFLRASRAADTDGGPGLAGARLSGASPASWINSWYTDNGADDTLVGALDVLYRQNTSINEQDTFNLLFSNVSTSNGLLLQLHTFVDDPGTGEDRLQLRLIEYGASAPATRYLVSSTVPFRFEADRLYHIAIVAEGASGATVLKVFIKEGDVPIYTDTDTPIIETNAFNLDDNNDLTQAFADFTRIGLTGAAFDDADPTDNVDHELHLDFDRFRIYNDVPTVIPGTVVPDRDQSACGMSAERWQCCGV